MAIQQDERKKAATLHVKVIDNTKDNHPTVNINVPVGLVKFGMKMAQAFSPELKDAKIDWESISQMLDEGALGEIVHVEDEVEHKTVDVWVE
jgi:hypothetical protein